MAELKLFGAELSPYSVKVRSYLRFKGLPFAWLNRMGPEKALYDQHAKLPLVPLVVTPEGEGLQDSTPIIETLEARHPEPALQPEDPAAAFLSALLEEYADEWGNKWMFHYRWTYEPDQISAAERIAESLMPGAPGEQVRAMAGKIRERMVPRLSFVGSSDATRPIIEDSFTDAVTLLEAHLAGRPYLFGARPALGDLGLFGQLYECAIDPTAGAILRQRAPLLLAWIERMHHPRIEGPFEPLARLWPTLRPLLERDVAGLFMPWTHANAAALEAGRETMEVELAGRPFSQQPQKYHARSLKALKARLAALPHRAALDPLLAETGLQRWLAA